MIARHLILAAVAAWASGLFAGCGERQDPGAFRLIAAAPHGPPDLEAMSLEEIFVALCGPGNGRGA